MDGGPKVFEVFAENWSIVQAFLAMATQWIWTGGMEPRRAGLNYAALPVVYEGLAISRRARPQVFQGIQTMEIGALEAFD